jgi:hypothetical protein
MFTTRQRLYEIARLKVKLFEARLDFLREKYIPLLATAIGEQKIRFPAELHAQADHLYGQRAAGFRSEVERREFQLQTMAETLFDAIAEHDPDFHKKNTQWMLNVILSGGSLVEDLEKATYYLTIFERVKKLLPVEARDLNIKRYPSFADLYVAIEAKEKELSKREADRQRDVAMHGEATVIMDTPKFKIVTPNTEAASCHFGVNTQWCTTAAYRHNQFGHYNSEGPLYIILDKENNRRYQYHFPSGQFVNERDQRIDINQFRETYPEIFKMLSEQLPKPVGSLANMPVYRMPIGSFYVRASPYIDPRPMAAKINVKDGDLVSIDSGKLDLSPSEVAHLLNHLHVKGNPTGGTNPNLLNLYYRPIGGDIGFEDMRWQTITEVSKPFIKFPDGWMWRGIKVDGGLDLILTAPGNEEMTNRGTMRKDGFACEAYVAADGSFSVESTPIYPTGGYDGNNATRRRVIGRLLGKYIVDLLLQMNSIKSWDKNSEFSPSYLDQADATRLIEAKPNLGDLKTVFKAKGVTPATKRMVINALNKAEVEYVDKPKGRWFEKDKLVVKEWNDIDDAIDDLATEDGKRFYEHYIKENNVAVYDHPGLEYYRGDLLAALKKDDPDLFRRLGDYLQSEYADTIADMFDGAFDPTSVREIEELLKEVDDHVVDEAMSNAVLSGLEAGIEGEAHKTFNKEIAGKSLYFLHSSVPGEPGKPWKKLKKPKWTHELVWDVPVMLAVPIAEVVDLLDDSENLAYEGWIDSLGDDYKIDPQEPYNGFDGYDDDVAAERFLEEIHDQLP